MRSLFARGAIQCPRVGRWLRAAENTLAHDSGLQFTKGASIASPSSASSKFTGRQQQKRAPVCGASHMPTYHLRYLQYRLPSLM